MKKIVLTVISVLVIVLFASCSENIRIPEVSTAVDGDAAVTYNGTDYLCHITYVNNRTASVELQSPDSLKGLTFRRTQDGQSFALNKLLCKSSCFRFGESCIGTQIMQLFDGIKPDRIKFVSQKGELFLFSAKDNTAMTFLTDSEGHIKTLSAPNLTIDFP